MRAQNIVNAIRVTVSRQYKRLYVRDLIAREGQCRFCPVSDIEVLVFAQTSGRWPLKRSVADLARDGASWKSLNQAISRSSVVCLNHAKKLKDDPSFLPDRVQEEVHEQVQVKDERSTIARLKREYSL